MENEQSPRRGAAVRLVRTVLWDIAKIGAIFVVAIGASLWLFSPSCACSTKEKAYVSRIKSDLRTLQSSQEVYYADHETYSASLSGLLMRDIWAEGRPTVVFQPSEGVTVILDDVTSDGFIAQATHVGTPVQCVVFGGNMRHPDPAIEPGEISCSEP